MGTPGVSSESVSLVLLSHRLWILGGRLTPASFSFPEFCAAVSACWPSSMSSDFSVSVFTWVAFVSQHISYYLLPPSSQVSSLSLLVPVDSLTLCFMDSKFFRFIDVIWFYVFDFPNQILPRTWYSSVIRRLHFYLPFGSWCPHLLLQRKIQRGPLEPIFSLGICAAD